MLFHLSIDANDPQRVAAVLAELFGNGAITPFPPVAEGSWLAMAGDDRNTMVEVYPRGTELHEAEGGGDAIGITRDSGPRRSATHFAMASRLSRDAILAIAAREGWPAKYCNRGGMFGVIELWLEGDRMIEVLTDEMQAEYLAAMTVCNWQAVLAAGAPA